jgi:hypothetical protein
MRAPERDVRRYVRDALAVGLEPDDTWVTRAANNNPGWTEAEIRQLVVAFGGCCAAAAAPPPAPPVPAPIASATVGVELPDLEFERLLAKRRLDQRARQQLAREQRGTPAFPEALTLRERLARTDAGPLPMRVAALQPQGGNLLLSAQSKVGKTTTLENLIRSYVDGDPFLDRFDVMPVTGTVALIDVEMSASQQDAWFRAQNIRRDDRVLALALKGRVAAFDILEATGRRPWVQLLRERRVEVLILDCLRPVLDVLGLDEHHDTGTFLVALDALACEAGISEIVLVQHMGHGGERARGDSRIGDWPAVEWQLVRHSENPAAPRYLRAFGRDVHLPESRLEFDPVTRRLSLHGTRDDAVAAEALPAVLAVLEATPEPLSGRAIKAALKDTVGAPSRDAIDAALRYGVRTLLLSETAGRHGAKLYARVQCPVK